MSPPKFTSAAPSNFDTTSASARSTAYSLPMPPKSSSMPAGTLSRLPCSCRRSKPMRSRSAATSAGAGKRPDPSNFHARRSTPEVMSKAPPGKLVAARGELQQQQRFRIQVHRPAAALVQQRDDAVGAIAAVLALDAPGLGRHGFAQLPRQRLVGRGQQQLAGTGHRRECRGDHTIAARLDLHGIRRREHDVRSRSASPAAAPRPEGADSGRDPKDPPARCCATFGSCW